MYFIPMNFHNIYISTFTYIDSLVIPKLQPIIIKLLTFLTTRIYNNYNTYYR